MKTLQTNSKFGNIFWVLHYQTSLDTYYFDDSNKFSVQEWKKLWWQSSNEDHKWNKLYLSKVQSK